MHQLKPENVLKRSQEYVKVGKQDQALSLMFDMLSNRRNRTWLPAHEKVMEKYITLCVEARNNKMAKEGLHQYRNLSLQQAPNSLENVIEFMLSSATKRTKKAAAECNVKNLASEIDDLENDKTPESVLLEAVTADRSKERTEREVLVPWLKFLWESFRTVLEILRHNSKLEHVYHQTAFRAFSFCKEYKRMTEFRRLCEILRNHMNPNKYKQQDKELVLTVEATELHLATRFEQLKVASSLRIWHEGFRTIEDIHYIMTLSNKRPSSQLMATYYHKLTQLFLISENYLFHAYAYKAFYFLSKEKNKSLSKQDSKIMASCVLLAAMSIPLQNSKAGRTITEEGMQRDKNRRMAQLLGFDINPHRKSIIKELIDNGILESVFDEVKQLYLILEEEFTPLDLVHKTMPQLKFLRDQERLNSYVKPLEKLLVVRLISQLSTIYYSVKLDNFKSLLEELDMPYLEIEKTVVKAIKARQVQIQNVRIDHRAGCIRFGEDVMEEHRTRKLLSDMAVGLSKVCKDLEPDDAEQKRAMERDVLVQQVLGEVSRQHELILARKVTIEKRKEKFEEMQNQKIIAEQKRKQEAEAERQQAEQARLQAQRERREKAKADALRDEERLFEIKQQMAAEGVDLKNTDITSMTKLERENLIEETRRKAEQADKATERKIQAAAKKLDTIVRALRETERPKLISLCKESEEKDHEAFKAAWEEELKSGEANHKKGLETKKRFQRIAPFMESFQSPLISAWKEECDAEQARQIESIQTQQRIDKVKRARARRDEAKRAEEKRRLEEEARRREEEYRLEQEQRRQEEEKQRKIEEERQKKVAEERRQIAEERSRYEAEKAERMGDRHGDNPAVYRPGSFQNQQPVRPSQASFGGKGAYRPPRGENDDAGSSWRSRNMGGKSDGRSPFGQGAPRDRRDDKNDDRRNRYGNKGSGAFGSSGGADSGKWR